MKITTNYSGIKDIVISFSHDEVKQILIKHLLENERFRGDFKNSLLDEDFDNDDLILTLEYIEPIKNLELEKQNETFC